MQKFLVREDTYFTRQEGELLAFFPTNLDTPNYDKGLGGCTPPPPAINVHFPKYYHQDLMKMVGTKNLPYYDFNPLEYRLERYEIRPLYSWINQNVKCECAPFFGTSLKRIQLMPVKTSKYFHTPLEKKTTFQQCENLKLGTKLEPNMAAKPSIKKDKVDRKPLPLPCVHD